MDEVLFRYNRSDHTLSDWAHQHDNHIVIETHFHNDNEPRGLAALIQVQDQWGNPLALDQKKELPVEVGEIQRGRRENGVRAKGAEASWWSAGRGMLVDIYRQARGKRLVGGGQVRGGRWVVGGRELGA